MNRLPSVIFALAALLAGSLAASETQAQKLHAVLVADTTDGTIGPGIKANLSKMNALLNAISHVGGIPLVKTEVIDNAFDCKIIMEKVKALSVAPDDSVLFYYAGHGFRRNESQTNFPEFDCRRSTDPTTVELFKVADWIRTQTKPKFVISMADTCNVFVPSEPQIAAAAPPPTPDTKKLAFQRLFTKYSGSITISGATPGNPSWYMNAGGLIGGFFTNQFLKVLDNRILTQNVHVRWQDILTDVIQPITIPTIATRQVPQSETRDLVEPAN
jgi:caspase domain-containing protein